MGCDIHSVAQIYDTERRVWKTTAIHIAGDPRCYELFGYLAGVRCIDMEPFVAQRGLPTDFLVYDSQSCLHKAGFFVEHGSHYTLDPGEYDGTVFMGDHSHTWYTLDELERRITTKHRLWWDIGLLQIVAELRRIARRSGIYETKHIRYVAGFDS